MSEAPSTAPVPTAPVCYRHPSRETYIRCTRCDRPICPDCMNAAAVGHQCPECVSDGRRAQRPARTAFGGTGAGRAAYATRSLIGINVLVLVLSTALGGMKALFGSGQWGGLLGSGTSVTTWGSVIGLATYGPGGELHGVAAGEWWRLITAMFLHYGLLHLVLNMWALWQIGRYLEAELGPLRFLALYLLSGLGGNVAAYVFSAPNAAVAGASTAVFGLFAAIIIVNRRLKRDISSLIPLLVINLLFTVTVAGISIAGHIGGLIVGGIVAVVLAYAPAGRRNQLQLIGCLAVLALLVVAAIVRTMVLRG